MHDAKSGPFLTELADRVNRVNPEVSGFMARASLLGKCLAVHDHGNATMACTTFVKGHKPLEIAVLETVRQTYQILESLLIACIDGFGSDNGKELKRTEKDKHPSSRFRSLEQCQIEYELSAEFLILPWSNGEMLKELVKTL